MAGGSKLTEKHAAQYDRQIRLWGAEAQQRMLEAKVLIAGLTPAQSEMCKNVVLAGVSCTLIDTKTVEAGDVADQFFFCEEDIGKTRAQAAQPRIQALNDLTSVELEDGSLSSKDEKFLSKFNVLSMSGEDPELIARMGEICHRCNIKLFVVHTFGLFGSIFSDYGKHDYFEERPKSQSGREEPAAKKAKVSNLEKKTMSFCSYEEAIGGVWTKLCAAKSERKRPHRLFFGQYAMYEFFSTHGRYPEAERDGDIELLKTAWASLCKKKEIETTLINENFLSALVRSAQVQLVPVCAIVGGIAGQEVIKSTSLKDAPLQNYFFFDGETNKGIVEKIHTAQAEAPAASSGAKVVEL